MLAGIGRYVDEHGRALVVVILLAAGVLLVGRGVLRLVGVLG